MTLLGNDHAELDRLSKDLLINVTSFFRDPAVFQLLADQIIPELVASQVSDRPIRIWLAGCSTGEEAYSLMILFREYMAASGQVPKLQFFASDLDADAIAIARDGLYSDTIAKDVSPARLARFFGKEGNFYRVLPEIRAAIVFTVQDVLVHPPFSRIDMVLCRNLLIYLLPEAQERVFGLFHFALRKNGILVLGNSEAMGERDDRFTILSKAAHIYRHIGQHRPGEHRFPLASRDDPSGPRTQQSQAGSRQTELAELCRRLVLENHAPAAILINRKAECLFSLGPISRFVHVAPGHPTQDLFAMVLPAMRTRLRSAIQKAIESKARFIVEGVTELDGTAPAYRIDVLPVTHADEALLLICFPNAPVAGSASTALAPTPTDTALEHELEVTRAELQAAINDLEVSSDEQKAINDEASSLNEELQSTNEELLTSKEELQSINEEATALNTQLYEALARQRAASNDLQNVMISTNVATIFLDSHLRIRFFTPATKALFNVIQGDIGRPLSDLKALSVDSTLLTDAHAILTDHTTMEREVEAQNDIWYIRRILPYRADDGTVEGVVITFVDSTERRLVAQALQAARHDAEQASVAKSRFLAAASHDLRQPLQSLSLMRGLLSKKIRDGKTNEALELLARVDETSAAMSGMLDALLDITRIDSGNVQPELDDFPVGELLHQIGHEFAHVAKEQNLALHIVSCGLTIRSDRHMLGQMIRNLLSNALKYTNAGKVLLGCRHRGDRLRIEVWDTGIGIPQAELAAIFDEYHQIDTGARTRTRNRGLGLGLSIVQRLGKLLNHEVQVQSVVGRGSGFSIEIKLPTSTIQPVPVGVLRDTKANPIVPQTRTGVILVVEDDPEVRELLGVLLRDEGHQITTAVDGPAALAMLDAGMMRPDLLLTDFNLPGGMNGLKLSRVLRGKLRRDIPVIILTGDISAETMRDIIAQNCVKLNKPVKVDELTQAIQKLLPKARQIDPARIASPGGDATIYVIDDDAGICDSMRLVFEDSGQKVETFQSAEAFLAVFRAGKIACLLVDAYLPGMSGLDLLAKVTIDGNRLPAIMITGHSDVAMVVAAMQAGAIDFIEKPVGRDELLASVERALELARDSGKLVARQEQAARQIGHLTARQREIMMMVLAGHPSKNIAADLNISQRTVENHRAEIMRRTGVKSLPALARLAISAVPTA